MTRNKLTTGDKLMFSFQIAIGIFMCLVLMCSCTVHKTTIDLTAGTGSTILLNYEYNAKHAGSAANGSTIKYYENTAPTDSMRKAGYIPRR